MVYITKLLPSLTSMLTTYYLALTICLCVHKTQQLVISRMGCRPRWTTLEMYVPVCFHRKSGCGCVGVVNAEKV